ncbi:DUF3052 domain-containing protein [Streptomyces sp. NPDC001795]|uniref:DUF3052 domain-containing protein n=1 Tax=Streptomyces sp. NPDC001795 TaxID=3154525 RepID=UPI00332DDB1A
MNGSRPASAATGGYSGTPLAKKIGIKAGQRVRIVHRPEGWAIPGLPEGCDVSDGGPQGTTDIVLAFFRARKDLDEQAAGLARALAPHAMLWIAWPCRAAGHESDITENALRELLLPLGVVDVKVASLGEDWSGLKFVWRKELRGSVDPPR